MKYARTKDGRLLENPQYNLTYKEQYAFQHRVFGLTQKEIGKKLNCSYQRVQELVKQAEKKIEKLNNSVMKTADTIEELCDEFVAYTSICEIIDKDEIDFYKKGGATIYGAIWTDKGLIYVAKMNDEGELELL